MSSILRNILFVIMMSLLLLPIVQDGTHFIHSMPLKGAVAEPVYKKLSWENWWDRSYQDALSEYAKGKTGLRPDIIRLNNQLDYSLLGKVRAGDVTIGKDGYLFGTPFIDRYCGNVRLTHDQWVQHLYKLKKIQDTLSRLGITMISIHAASKASYYPEYFPAGIKCDNQQVDDHEIFDHIADSLGITLIDFNHWFVSLKGKTKGNLFTRLGLHWSMYGAVVSADSFVRYLQHTAKINVPDMRWQIGAPQSVPRYADIDIFQELNLMMPPDKETYYYPDVTFSGSGREKPKIIYIADSFMWNWVFNNIPQGISDEWEFWYYNSTIFTAHNGSCKMADYNWPAHLIQARCVVVMFSEASLNDYGAGFVENTYNHFYLKSHQ